MRIVLASKSPRRIEILSKFAEFESIPSLVEEKYSKRLKPREIAMYLSLIKALDVEERIKEKNALIISADTIVVLDEILEKPKSREEAFCFLQKLKGRVHKVITGYTILNQKNLKKITDFEETKVQFGNYDNSFIDKYLDKNEYIDKAGAYAIQGYGKLLVKKITGDYMNIVGFPIYSISQHLKNDFNIDLMD
ncbi:MAG TPA: septum formation protein Maf [Clostridiales bacterium]|nr:septum formation protein Maf [Clostridiales bacterium]